MSCEITPGVQVELWELTARESIRDLVARYNVNGDAGRFDHVLELFAPDATMDVGDGRTYTGADEIRSIFIGTKVLVTAGAGAPGFVRHFTSTLQVDVIDRTNATGRSYYHVLTAAGLDHWGRYVDAYRKVDGAWRFRHRRVTIDGHHPASTIAGRRS
jgi:hypothetical protein